MQTLDNGAPHTDTRPHRIEIGKTMTHNNNITAVIDMICERIGNNTGTHLITLFNTLGNAAEKLIGIAFFNSRLIAATPQCHIQCLSCPLFIFLEGTAAVSDTQRNGRIHPVMDTNGTDIIQYTELFLKEPLDIPFFHDNHISSAAHFLIKSFCSGYPFHNSLFHRYCYLNGFTVIRFTFQLIFIVKGYDTHDRT